MEDKMDAESGMAGSDCRVSTGRVSEKDFIYAGVATPLSHRHGCQAHFYVGAKALSAGDFDEYRASLERAVAISAGSLGLEPEYHLARYELKRYSQPQHEGATAE